ncbi:Receptor-like protein kinase HSL1 [Acorus gramineus]|uniref:non-specific serine/threonine protein kinase n=1 Tax=Acorus gramineus TaxID=55184 RepID=A0AAV9AXX8_ACOGR|nr:Receptor-like protein kinase HSL1 [Acorus gramineus]
MEVPLLLLLLLLPITIQSLTQEGLYLQQAKLSLDDPDGSLSDWNPRDPNPCNWSGVTCTTTTTSTTVTSIDLTNMNLSGPFPSILCRLPNLTHLFLSLNYINSSLSDPSTFSGCSSLQHLDLSMNSLIGSLPKSLPSLPSLRYVDFGANNFTGEMPDSYGLFPMIETLSLVNNLLNHTISPVLGNLSTLKVLNLSYNPFSPGPIPPEFGNLTNLETLWLSGCNLVGSIPPELGNLKRVINLDVSNNGLTGSIPDTLKGLESVVQIELYNNSLSGAIPLGLGKLAKLRRFDASMNGLIGWIPDDLCRLPLESLNLYTNSLEGPIPEAIAGSLNLYELKLFENKLSGKIPSKLGKVSPLVTLDLSVNQLSGDLPPEICGGGALEELLLIQNSLSGSLPEGLSRCRTLTRVRLGRNSFSGPVPDGVWGLPLVYLLELSKNSFSGSIPPAISGASNLSSIDISGNGFTGSIPPEIGRISGLYEFSAADNLLSGPIPAELGHLAELGILNLRNNSLNGELLKDIKSWGKLTDLDLAMNDLTGPIPPEIGDLPVLNYFDLSANRLSGEIPTKLQNLKLNRFNLSDNELSGDLPPLYNKQMYKDSFLGNPGLCGDLPGLCPPGSGPGGPKNRGFNWVLLSIFMLAAFIFVVGVGWFYWKYRAFKKAKQGIDKSKWILTSFHKLGFSEYEILDCLDEDNVIGSGASGKVYKAVLSNGETVAVKKLWGVAKKEEQEEEEVGVDHRTNGDDEFEAEVATLGKIRHKNIVKLWCCCVHKDCKLLVYEYMPNGSLGDLLHSSKAGILDWPMRYKIALDAAEGLSYLHHDCVPPIVHRDVKSNNILLDAELGARVADFGVAKVVDGAAATGKGPKSMSVIAGSCGYIAPEYAYTLRVNEKSDIYSFGVVLLELVTGKRPVDPEFGEKDLVKWVCSILEQKGEEEHVIDPKLDLCYKEEIIKVLNIGLLCASSLPINRPSMRRVVKMLIEVAGEPQKAKEEKKDGKLSPYYYEDVSFDQGSIV